MIAEPISVRIPMAVAMTGLSRSRLYELIASGEIDIAKDGRTTLIIVDSLRRAVSRQTLERSAQHAIDPTKSNHIRG